MFWGVGERQWGCMLIRSGTWCFRKGMVGLVVEGKLQRMAGRGDQRGWGWWKANSLFD